MSLNFIQKLNIPLNQLNFKYKIILYTILLFLLIFVTLIYCYLFINKFPNNFDPQFNLIVEKIEFGNGSLISSLLNNGEYKSKYYGIDFYLQKLPILPIFYYLILRISENFFFFIIFKNIITFSCIYFTCFYSLKSLNKNLIDLLILVGFIFIIPYNLFVFLNYQYTDCLLVVMLPSLFLVLISKLKFKFIYATLILFFLYLTKTSTVYLVYIIPLFVIFYEKRSYKKYIILLGPILATLLWGTFGYQKINKFVLGSNLLSVNPMGIYLVTHKDFYEYFPYKSIDILQNKIEIPQNIKNETQFFEYFQNKNEAYFAIAQNKKKFFIDSFKKIKFIMFNIRRDSAFMENYKFNNSIRYSLIPNKIIFNLSIIFSIVFFIRGLKKNINSYDLYFISIISLNMLPYVAAWATSKHLIPAFIISFYYLYLRLSNFYLKNE